MSDVLVLLVDVNGWVCEVCYVLLLNFEMWFVGVVLMFVVVYNISLLFGEFGGDVIEVLFLNCFDCDVYFYYQSYLCGVCVFVYFLICCGGEFVQFVLCDECVWYVGLFEFFGCMCCNDFLIGIEFEGVDDVLFDDV